MKTKELIRQLVREVFQVTDEHLTEKTEKLEELFELLSYKEVDENTEFPVEQPEPSDQNTIIFDVNDNPSAETVYNYIKNNKNVIITATFLQEGEAIIEYIRSARIIKAIYNRDDNKYNFEFDNTEQPYVVAFNYNTQQFYAFDYYLN